MRKLLWMIFLFATYIWVLSSGREEWFFDQGKAIYRVVAAWFEDAELDFQLKKSQHTKNSRRWN